MDLRSNVSPGSARGPPPAGAASADGARCGGRTRVSPHSARVSPYPERTRTPTETHRPTQVQYDGVHLQTEKHCQRPRLGHTQPRVQCHPQPNERHFLEQQDHLVNQLKLDLLHPLVQLDSRGLHVPHDVEHHPELHLLLVNLSNRYQHPKRTLLRINISLWFNLSCSW
ncbi:hypothetical protein GN958_ATG02587 [Phytophthora infestans]|uniref:Uncharacterized protein n=1 Tax=Phytophthora infestans TaxID=4787 RepID=A0A8S9V6X6_PHYIN|nr:hypothetical protein GN958_ATG02587 [Phytophthora infestans]